MLLSSKYFIGKFQIKLINFNQVKSQALKEYISKIYKENSPHPWEVNYCIQIILKRMFFSSCSSLSKLLNKF